MSDRYRDQKTNIDDVFLPSWLLWLAWWFGISGFFANILFVFAAFGWTPPVQDVYFSPVLYGRAIHQAWKEFTE